MCRRRYNNIYLKDEEQIFKPILSEDLVYNPGFEIDITQEQYSIFQDVMAACFSDYIYKWYRTAVNNNVFCFVIIHSIDID